VAQKIHDLTENDPEAQAMAHAVLGAVTSYAAGNSALAGAAGGVSGELMAKLVMNQLYPDKTVSDLSETEMQTISALGTLAAGLAGGVTGDSTANVLAGAQAGQNAVNDNLFGGTEDGQEKFVREHGKDVMSCADDPTSASCQRGEAVNKAIAVTFGAGAAGGAVVAATPELIAAAQAAASGCGLNPLLCANEISIWVAEMAAGDALPAGLTAATVSKMPAETLSELKALMTVEKQTGSKVTKESLVSVVTTSHLSTGTVFDSIKATQPAIPGTSIPKSFELNVNGQTFLVNPNATKHMGEYLTRNGLSHSTTEGSQAMLTSLQSAIKDASVQGLHFNEKMQVGRWELIFSQRPTDPYPVLKHALYK